MDSTLQKWLKMLINVFLPSLEEVDVVELVELDGKLDGGLELPAHGCEILGSRILRGEGRRLHGPLGGRETCKRGGRLS